MFGDRLGLLLPDPLEQQGAQACGGGERGAGEPGGFGGPADLGGADGPGGGGGLGGGIFGSTSLSASQQQLYRYLSAHRDGAGYLLAVSSWSEASAYILATGQEIMPMGGFSGSVPEPTLARVKQPVATGQLRFFLLGGAGGFGGAGGRGGADGTTAQVTSWAESACAAVPARDYGAASGGTGTLYECGSPMVSTAARTLFSQFKGTCLISARFCHLD